MIAIRRAILLLSLLNSLSSANICGHESLFPRTYSLPNGGSVQYTQIEYAENTQTLIALAKIEVDFSNKGSMWPSDILIDGDTGEHLELPHVGYVAYSTPYLHVMSINEYSHDQMFGFTSVDTGSGVHELSNYGYMNLAVVPSSSYESSSGAEALSSTLYSISSQGFDLEFDSIVFVHLLQNSFTTDDGVSSSFGGSYIMELLLKKYNYNATPDYHLVVLRQIKLGSNTSNSQSNFLQGMNAFYNEKYGGVLLGVVSEASTFMIMPTVSNHYDESLSADVEHFVFSKIKTNPLTGNFFIGGEVDDHVTLWEVTPSTDEESELNYLTT